MTQRSQFSFNQAAEAPKQKSKPTAQYKKRPAPLSVRVSNAEREWIKRKAGSQSVNAFVRERIFSEQPRSKAVDNRKDIARLLAALGRSGMAASLRSLAHSAEIGALELATFSADRDQLIERVKSGVRQPTEKFEPSPSDKLEMLQVRIDRGRYVPIYDREVSTSELEASEIAEAKNVELGIKWDCSSCDLDIYARPGPGADILYFGRTRSREGVFHKDFVQGRDLMNGLETISFSAPINLNELLIAVNLYSGHQADGISGEVRLAVDGRTYAREFKISAEKGNRASGLTNLLKSGSATNDAWITIDPVALVSAQ